MRITQIETFTAGRQLCVVRVRTDDGGEGFGQMAPGNADISATVLHRQIAPVALGADPTDMDALSDRMFEATYKYPGSYVCRALSGLDTALWDLLAKRAGQSVCELLGGRPRPVAAYASSTDRRITADAEAERLARLRDIHGFRAFKFKIGKRCGHDQDEWPGRNEAILPAVRHALGDDALLFVDANSAYSPAKAIEVGRLLEQHGIAHYEEPCPWWELEWTAEVARALTVPVGGGEQDFWLPTWQRMIEMRAVDVVQPDICYLGGMSRTLRVARMAHAAGLPCMPHNPNLTLIKVFTAHLLCAIPNAAPYIEFGIEPGALIPGFFDPEPVVKDGFMPFPEGTGWGVTINPNWLERAERMVSSVG